MKNAILYYYNLNSNDIHQNGKQFKFTAANDSYLLLPLERDPNDLAGLFEISQFLLQNQIYCHEIIRNQNGSFFTEINQIAYILLRSRIMDDSLVTLKDITTFSRIPFSNDHLTHLKREDWGTLWTNKMDYLEYQVSQFGKKYPAIRESFSYFEGMAETAIFFFKQIQDKSASYLTVAHRRMKNTDSLFDLYNPLSFILDYRVRDAAEYFKDQFFSQSDLLIEQIKEYIGTEQLTMTECQLFLARMLYPSFYFDAYEEIIEEGKDEKKLLTLLEKAESYQKYLQEVYLTLRNFIMLPDIEWLLR